MEKQSLKLFAVISKEKLKNLTTEVKETVSKECKQKAFSTVDLWDIRRRKKPVLVRSFTV